MPLIGLALPAIAELVFEMFNSLATYDLFEAQGISEMIFEFDE